MPRTAALSERPADLVKVVVMITAIGLGLMAVIPLFPVYQDAYNLSTGDLTLVFSVYGFAFIPAVILVGSHSDALSRKALLIPALAGFAFAAVLFAQSRGLSWLLLARAVQGVCNGAAFGAGAAFVRDLVADGRRGDAAMIVSMALPGSGALGVAVFGAASDLPSGKAFWSGYAVLLVVVAVVVLTVSERARVRPSGQEHRRIRLVVPATDRRLFVLFLSPITFALFGIMGVFISILPSMLAAPGASEGAGGVGTVLSLFLVAVAGVQPITRRLGPWTSTCAAAFILPVAFLVLVTAWGLGMRSLLLVIVGLLGIGGGLAFRGTLALTELMSVPEDRSGVLSSYNLMLFLGFSVPAVIVGYAADLFGLLPALLGFVAFSSGIVALGYASRLRVTPGLNRM